MDESDVYRRLRLVIDVERRPVTDEERERQLAAQRMTPNAIRSPVESVWTWSVRAVEPDDATAPAGGGRAFAFGADDERLPLLIAAILGRVSSELPIQLTRQQVPLDQRFIDLIGASRIPDRSEVAERTAALLELRKPTRPATDTVLVMMVLASHAWYHDPGRPTESTDLGHGIVSHVQSLVSADAFCAALEDLGVANDVELWSVAARLVRSMGFDVW